MSNKAETKDHGPVVNTLTTVLATAIFAGFGSLADTAYAYTFDEAPNPWRGAYTTGGAFLALYSVVSLLRMTAKKS